MKRGWLACAALLFTAACAHQRAGSELVTPPTEARPGGPESGTRASAPQVGLASFYGHRHRGRLTASGVRYDPAALTCAHRTEPFGTRLQVTELTSGRSVVVTVNDRGPFLRGRIVDLSLAAARVLRMIERGVARVRIERVE